MRADLLASRYQRLYRAAVVWIYSLALLAVTGAVVELVVWPEHHLLTLVEVFALLAAWTRLCVNRRERWREKHLNDRYLAEWLRRAQYMVLLPPEHDLHSRAATAIQSIQPSTPLVGDSHVYRGTETWFVSALDHVTTSAARQLHRIDDIPEPDVLRRVLLEGLVQPQIDAHTNKARWKHHLTRYCECATLVLFGATLILAIAHVPFGRTLHGAKGNLVTILVIVLPAAAATLHVIERLFDFERSAARAERMTQRLRPLADDMEAAETIEELRQAVKAIDRQMAHEVEDWWVGPVRNLVSASGNGDFSIFS